MLKPLIHLGYSFSVLSIGPKTTVISQIRRLCLRKSAKCSCQTQLPAGKGAKSETPPWLGPATGRSKSPGLPKLFLL